MSETFTEKLESGDFTVAVLGLGYVGLPLAVEFGRAGLRVVGVDVNADRVAGVNAGRSYVGDVNDGELAALVHQGRLSATPDFAVLAASDAAIICVPTPLNKTKDPDISYITAALDQIIPRLHRGMLVVLESTTYPGTTEELARPRLEQSGQRAGRDFFLAFSPERVDPGNKRYVIRNTPKVVGGCTPACTAAAVALYGKIVEKVVPVSSPAAAEMTKLLENTFRAVNIALANEIALACDRMGLDVWEVITAAATKPFGFMSFYPGPGLGGHCLPVDPLYLSWKLKTLNAKSRFIELADEINSSMPEYWVRKVYEALNEQGRAVKGARLLVLGVAYKPGVSDVRESPALEILERLSCAGAEVSYSDPYVPVLPTRGPFFASVPLTPESVRGADCVMIVSDHQEFDYAMIAANARLVVDTRHALRRRAQAGSA